MNINKQFKDILQQTKVLRNPKHRLATFGHTRIRYFFVSVVGGFKDRSRLREGLVIAENPRIITPEILKNRFEGFGSDSGEFGKWLSNKYGEAFQGLEYKFKNEFKSSRIEYSDIKTLIDQVKRRSTPDSMEQNTIIQGPDQAWQISIMKFIVDECMASFTDNVKELNEHGYFDTPEKVLSDQKKEIERLFVRSRRDKSTIPTLGKRLHQYSLFKEYEDQFFKLIQN